MNRKSVGNIVAIIFGVVLGIIVLLFRTIWRVVSGKSTTGEEATRLGEQARHALDDVRHRGEHVIDEAKERADHLMHRNGEDASDDQVEFGFPSGEVSPEPNVGAGQETVVQGTGDRTAELTNQQHGELGGVPEQTDEGLDTGLETASEASDQSTFVSRDESVQTPPDFAYGSAVSEEGVELTLQDDTGRTEDRPLDEGIPNLGEPGDVEDTTAATEDAIETADGDVSEDFGQSESTDSISYDDRWIGDVSTEADAMPSASRGLADDNEVSGEEMDIEDTDETGDLGLYEDPQPSGAGGEVDLENDESPAYDESEMTIVDSPDDPVSLDEGARDDEELTLGLRDSESVDATSGEHLGTTGTFDEADQTQRVPASPTDADAGDARGDDLRQSFVTGEEYQESDTESGMTPDESLLDREEDSRERYLSGDAAEPDIPTTSHGEHLGTTGDFGEADETEKIPAVPTGDEEDAESLASRREPFVTGDQADKAEDAAPGDVDVADDDSTDQSHGAYSAAWSSPAGVVNQMTSQGAGDQEMPDDERGDEPRPMDDVTQPDDSGLSEDIGGDDLADAGVDAFTDEDDDVGEAVEDAGSSGDETGEPDEGAGESTLDRHAGDGVSSDTDTVTTSTPPSSIAGGDPADLATSSAGDLGTTTGGDRPTSSGDAVDQARGAGEEGRQPRKSRRERRNASGRVPEGAVRGDSSGSCPADYPIKGNANSRIYHRPSDQSYEHTIPEFCFASEQDAQRAGFRAPRGR